MRLLLVGCGSIGGAIAQACDGMPAVDAVLLLDEVPGAAAQLAERVKKARAIASFEEGLADADLVVEAASQEAARRYATRALDAGKDLVLLSAGALADDALREAIEAAARRSGARVHVPSGAIAGLDGLRAAREAALDEVILTTSKPPAGLGFAQPLTGPVEIFRGPAREAVKTLPKNVNVAASLALAGIGLDRTLVRVVADPALRDNTHSILARGEFGELRVEVRNRPFPSNPRTSHLAALSAIALLRRLAEPIQVG